MTLLQELADAFHGRPPSEAWWYSPPAVPAGWEQIRVCRPSDGYDFARLDWQTCEECRTGYLVKIRVSPDWQRQGYATRIVARALRGREAYRWNTTGQSAMAREFFPAFTAAAGVEFTVLEPTCAHMHAARQPLYGTARKERPPRLRRARGGALRAR
ncbi:GNAT family N-acetyltransferase [Streptomyces acidiscabies]|uniref:N-acetyltransferase domain-containing protein n=1 Tax=Streptomyces acidiscabies TaxID=42234 RepID=A0ABU4MC56_9ACTN|nr:GNAT family N-acetyltransferase [Streptomyces acidiscabies]MDX3025396.1 hypothetical protein [Streptomyces acidiscabies]